MDVLFSIFLKRVNCVQVIKKLLDTMNSVKSNTFPFLLSVMQTVKYQLVNWHKDILHMLICQVVIVSSCFLKKLVHNQQCILFLSFECICLQLILSLSIQSSVHLVTGAVHH